MLLRLAHLFGLGEDAEYSNPVSVDLSTLLNETATGFRVLSVEEVSLTNNQPKSALLAVRAQARLWHSQDGAKPHAWRTAPPLDWPSSPVVTLGALEIKSFQISIAP